MVTLTTMFARGVPRLLWPALLSLVLGAACADPAEPADGGFPDAALLDAEAPDAGFPDAEPDAGFPDAEPVDAEPTDSGFSLTGASLTPGAQLHATEGHRLRSRLTAVTAVTSTTSTHRLRGGLVPQWP